MLMNYPIILVHGVLLKDVLHFRSFGRIEKILKKENHAVYSSPHDGLGTIENNATQIKAYILKVLELENAKKEK